MNRTKKVRFDLETDNDESTQSTEKSKEEEKVKKKADENEKKGWKGLKNRLLEDIPVLIEENKELPDEPPQYGFSADSLSSVISQVNLNSGQIFSCPERDTWTSKTEFLISMIGYTVDISNVWRFPYLCFRFGGGSFLYAYLIILAFCGVPIVYLELIMGQFVRQGPIGAWKISPMFKGIGYGAILISFAVTIYYNTIMCWALAYAIEGSLSQITPVWTRCDNSWNTERCSDLDDVLYGRSNNSVRRPPNNSSASEYFKGRILRIWKSGYGNEKEWHEKGIVGTIQENGKVEYGLNYIGGPNLDLTFYMVVIYTILLFYVLKGIRTTGKLLWVTTMLPYCLLAILLFKGICLPGASMGMEYFWSITNSSLFLNAETWATAATQMFYSSGCGYGVHITHASYNSFNHNILRDGMIAVLVNSLTSILAGVALFSYLGFLAHSLNVTPLQNLSIVDLDLSFEIFPLAIGDIPGAGLLFLSFYVMIFLLGFDTSLAYFQTIVTGICDDLKKKDYNKTTVALYVLFLSLFLSLLTVTKGGIYFVSFFDSYVSTEGLMLIILFQTVAVVWVWGLENVCDAAEAMVHFRPNLYFRLCWKYIAPLILLVVVIASVLQPVESILHNLTMPTYMRVMGIILAWYPAVLVVPLMAILCYCRTPVGRNWKKRLLICISPEYEHASIRSHGTGKRSHLDHWTWFGGWKWYAQGQFKEIPPAREVHLGL